ncbi:MAG: type II toxin-antitoxin system HicB family antitoxin [Elusimicrobia bacterium]|nr:type II toxin-antitoxin system HicB family antitoxin [Elusimicrobiota bacterium]
MGGRKGKRKVKQYHLTAVVWKEGRRYVSKCPELGVASFGATPESAQASLKEAVSLFISNAKRLRLLKDVEPSMSSGTRFTTPLEIALA